MKNRLPFYPASRLFKLFLLSFLLLPAGAYAQTREAYEHIADSLESSGQKDQIIPYFLNELKTKPETETVLRILGYYYFMAQERDKAEPYYHRALQVNPGCAVCYTNLGQIYVIKGDSKQAFDYIAKAIAADPADARPLALRAQLKEMNGDKIGAAIDIDKAIALSPESAALYAQRAQHNVSRGFTSMAMEDLTKAISLERKNYSHYYQRANLYYEDHQFKKALADMNVAIELDSTQAELYTGRGAIWSGMEDHAKALKDYSTAIRMQPDNYYPYYNRSLTRYSLEDMDGSCEDLHTAYSLLAQTDPENEFLDQLSLSIANHCDSSKASYYYQRGIAFYNLGFYDKSLAAYDRGLKKFPSGGMLYSFRGNAHFAQKDYEAAITDYQSALENQASVEAEGNLEANAPVKDYYISFGPIARMSLSESFFALGSYDKALKEINEAIKTAPAIKGFGMENFYQVRGIILLAKGEYKEAVTDFDKCIELDPQFALAYVNRAIAKMYASSGAPVRSYTVSGGLNNEAFNVNWTLPDKLSFKKSDQQVISALSDCESAIQLEPTLALAFYVSGRIKKTLGYSDSCYDLFKARNLGYEVENEFLTGCGQ